jgi:hypothetical protein
LKAKLYSESSSFILVQAPFLLLSRLPNPKSNHHQLPFEFGHSPLNPVTIELKAPNLALFYNFLIA